MSEPIIEALYLCDREKNYHCDSKDVCDYNPCKLTKYPEFAKNLEAVKAFNNFIKHFEIQVYDVTDQQRIISCIEKEK